MATSCYVLLQSCQKRHYLLVSNTLLFTFFHSGQKVVATVLVEECHRLFFTLYLCSSHLQRLAVVCKLGFVSLSHSLHHQLGYRSDIQTYANRHNKQSVSNDVCCLTGIGVDVFQYCIVVWYGGLSMISKRKLTRLINVASEVVGVQLSTTAATYI